jgi:hypothetical protein
MTCDKQVVTLFSLLCYAALYHSTHTVGRENKCEYGWHTSQFCLSRQNVFRNLQVKFPVSTILGKLNK